jgi:prolyl oligopeptidase
LAIMAMASGASSVPAQPAGAPRATRRDDFRELLHGVEIVDPYRWLEDQESAETRTWIDAQNRYAHSLLDPLPVRERIKARLAELMKIDTVSGPVEAGGDYFYWKKRAADDLPVYYRRHGLHGNEEVVLDPHPLSPDHTTSAGVADLSEDGSLLAYTVRRGGEDEVELRVMDVRARKDLPDRLPRALYGSVSFKTDNSGFYYSRRTREAGGRIYYHTMGTEPAQDREVFGKGYGPNTWLGASVSEDGRYLLLTTQDGWTRGEVFVQDLATGGPIRPVVQGIDAKFDAGVAGDRLVLMTDWQAPNRRVLVADLKDPARDRWREIVPAGPDAIQGFSLIGGKLFVNYLHNVATQIRVFDLDGRPQGEVELPGPGAGGIYGKWKSPEAFLTFTSFTTPYTVYRRDVATGKQELWSRNPVPIDPERFEVRQVWYASKDGTKIPMFLVHKKGLKPDGKLPTLLYGYGGFNASLTPAFNTIAALWAEQGGIYAVANLRGGGEFGEAWHRAGMLEKKQNVFDDFIAAAEWLIRNGYTEPSKLAIRGGSNGGLLVGAALTQRPELFQAVLCEYPDLDMIGYYRFKNNNPPALLEYGNASDPEQFKFLSAYSPYQRVKPGTKYPAVLMTTGDQDTRVPPLQARKMTARLQAATTSGWPVLLLYDTKAGHAGGRPFSKVVDDLSLELAFLFWQLGMEWQG